MTAPTEALAAELALSEAAEYARNGDYDAALRVVAPLDGDSPPTLDLLARVYAQRGDLDAADAAWRRLLAIRPDDPDALAGRRLIAEISAHRRRRRPVPVLALAGAAVVALLVAGLVLVLPVRVDEPGVAVRSTRQVQTPEPEGAQRERARRLAAEEAMRLDEAASLRRQLATLAASLAGPGVGVERRKRDVRVVFHNGLFRPDGNEFTRTGRRDLERWARRLTGKAVAITVVGHGVLVPGGPSKGGSTVAMSRGLAAADVISDISGLPLTAFVATSAEQSASPHTQPGPLGQVRNRTVSLLVAPV